MFVSNYIMNAKKLNNSISKSQIIQVWVLIFFTFLASVHSALNQDFSTQHQIKTHSLSENSGLRQSTIINNDVVPFNAEQDTTTQQQISTHFFESSGIEFAIYLRSLKSLMKFNDFEVMSNIVIATRKLNFPHHTFW